ncbi:MAG: hypothetical protein ABI355_02230 [Solirubrobacteraceae bacterium]
MSSTTAPSDSSHARSASVSSSTSSSPATTARARATQLGSPRLTRDATSTAPTNFVPAVTWRGQTAVYVARRPNLALISLNQKLVGLHLHSGTVDAGATGYRFGPAILGSERARVVAGFNGGFKLDTHSGGFYSGGRTGAALSPGLGSIVTYTDGSTDIGAWHEGVPAAGHTVSSVRQNLRLLVSGGHIASTVSCVICWGPTLGGTATPARGGLGITAAGNLIWAGGEHLSVLALAQALRSARVVRAVELDINPEWVAGYLYGHRGGRGAPAAVAVVPGQPGVPGQFLTPDSRDFFSVVAR